MINKRKYQQGGAAPASQQEQVQQVVSQISQMTGEQPETIMAAIQAGGENFKQVIQALEQGDTQTAKQMIQQLAQQGQQQATIARRGAKLQYIKDLKGTCPDGTHLEYYKAGGRLCKKCMKNQEGGELEQEKKGGVLSQYKDKVKKDCGGTKMDKCGGKMKKHQIGGTLETLRTSLGLEKKNLIKAQQGTKFGAPKTNVLPEATVNGIDRRLRFDRRTSELGNGHRVISDVLYDYYNGGNHYLGDLAQVKGGRTIYQGPRGNDTIFWKTPNKWLSSEGGFMDVGSPERGAKRNFYNVLRTNKFIPAHGTETAPLRRAQRGN